MSSATPAGAISIAAALDLTQAYAQLNEFRNKGFTVPLRAEFVGPGGSVGASGSLAGIGGGGPATFANPNGRAAFIGPSLANIGGASPGFAGANTAAAAQGTQQLTQAMQMLTATIQGMGAGAGGGGGGGSNPAAAGGGGGGNRFFGLRSGGLMRYVGLGFLTREALSLAQADSEYHVGSVLAGNRPSAQLANEQQLYKRFSGIPVFGQIASMIVDPGGVDQAGIGLASQLAGSGTDLMMERQSLRQQSRTAQRQADAAGSIGARRQLLDAQNAYESKKFEIGKERIDPARDARLAEDFEARKAKLLLNDPEAAAFLKGSPGEQLLAGAAVRKRAAGLQNALENEGLSYAVRRLEFDKPFKDMDAANEEKLAEEKKLILDGVVRTRADNVSEKERFAALSGPGGPNYSKLREIDNAREKREELAVFKDTGSNDSVIAYKEKEDARLNYESFQRHTRQSAEAFSMDRAADRLNIISGHDIRSMGQSRSSRQLLGQLQEILDTTEGNRQRLIRENGDEAWPLVQRNAREGRARLVAFRQQLEDSGSADYVTDFRSGIGNGRRNSSDRIRAAINRAFGTIDEGTAAPAGAGGSAKGNSTDQAKLAANSDRQTQLLEQIARSPLVSATVQ